MPQITVPDQDDLRELIEGMYASLELSERHQYADKVKYHCNKTLKQKESKRLDQNLEIFIIRPLRSKYGFKLIGWDVLCRELNVQQTSLRTMFSYNKNHIIITKFPIRFTIERLKKTIKENEKQYYDMSEGCLMKYLENVIEVGAISQMQQLNEEINETSSP